MGIKSISFAPEMVEALLDGRKTVTRRVIKAGESKPRWEEGDLLYVRERQRAGKHNNEKGWRDLSRIVLRVTEMGIEHLHALSAAEAMREGMIDFGEQHAPTRYSMKPHDLEVAASDPIRAFQKYWNTLVDPKSGARWEDGPNVRVIEFDVLATTHSEAQALLR